jgi:hypothetical protein
MRRQAVFYLALLFIILMASCQFPASKIKPGDQIGDMTFINEYEQCQAPNYNDICGGFDSLVDGTCEIPSEMNKFWISISLPAENQEALELAWKDSKWSMTFDGYNVDLASFGTFDWELDGQSLRSWNVCISNPKPGKHTVVYEYFIDHAVERGNFAVSHTFTVLAPASP